MDKAMGIGFILFFCVVFLMIEESSGIVMPCVEDSTLTVSPVLFFLILELDLAFTKLSS